MGSEAARGDRQRDVLDWIHDRGPGASPRFGTALLSGLRRDWRSGNRAGLRDSGRNSRQMVSRPQGTGHRHRRHGLRRRGVSSEQGTRAVPHCAGWPSTAARLRMAWRDFRLHSDSLQSCPEQSPGVAIPGRGRGRTADLNEAESAATYLRTPQFLIMWIVFFFNIAAGISVIGFQSEILQEVWGLSDPSVEPATLAAYGATLIAVSSICNGLARISHELSATAPDPSASARPLTRLIRRDERAATRPARGTRRSSDGVSDSSRRKPVRKAG